MTSNLNLGIPKLPKKLPETPFYFYDDKILEELVKSFMDSIQKNPQIVLHYAMKANSNPAILKKLHKYACGLDTVSGEELKVALKCGFKGERAVYSGVGKKEEELKLAITNEIGMIIVESREEFEELCVLAKKYPKKKVNVGFRFNPNLSVETHPYIATGLWDHKFGMAGDEIVDLLSASRPKNIYLKGLSLHLGSQIFDYKIFYDAVDEVIKLATTLRSKYKISFEVLNVGGGLGVNYKTPYEKPDFENYGKFLQATLEKWQAFNPQQKVTIYSECGRALVAQAGFLMTQVIRIKKNPKKSFAIVDASMTELIRPALYEAHHEIEKVSISKNAKTATEEIYDVVGPVCESGDFLGQARKLSTLVKGDYLWVTCAGAYGYVLSSQYNLRALPAEYLLKSGKLQKLRAPIKSWLKK